MSIIWWRFDLAFVGEKIKEEKNPNYNKLRKEKKRFLKLDIEAYVSRQTKKTYL